MVTTKSKRALVVIDIASQMTQVVQVLERMGFVCDAVDYHREALDFLEDEDTRYDLFLCQMEMGQHENSALQFMAYAHHSQTHGKVPFVVITCTDTDARNMISKVRSMNGYVLCLNNQPPFAHSIEHILADASARGT